MCEPDGGWGDVGGGVGVFLRLLVSGEYQKKADHAWRLLGVIFTFGLLKYRELAVIVARYLHRELARYDGKWQILSTQFSSLG